MKKRYRKSISISGVVPVAVGLPCSGIVVLDENGYVASMTFVIVFFLLLIASLIVLIAGLLGLAAQDKRIGVFLIVVSLLTPASFLAFHDANRSFPSTLRLHSFARAVTLGSVGDESGYFS